MRRKILLILFLTFALAWHLSLNAQDFEYLDKKIKLYTSWMQKGKDPNIWRAAARLKALGEKAIPLIKRKIDTLPDMAKVGCCKALIDLDEVDYGVKILLSVIKDGTDDQAKINAATLLGIHGDFELEDHLTNALEKTFNPYLKIALAKTLWQVARNPVATRTLKYFLKSTNIDIRYRAAITLAEIRNVQAVKPILSKLKDEPSYRGRLAKILLEQEAIISRYERLLSAKAKNVTKKNNTPKKKNIRYPLIHEIKEMIQKYHIRGDKLKDETLINAAIRGMVSKTDKHSAFWTKQQWDNFVKAIVKEEYVGVGIYVNHIKDKFVIVAPVYSGPAYRAGIRSQDIIVAINGWSTRGRSMPDMVKKIKGPPGSTLTLKIARRGWKKHREIKIKREKVRIPSLYYQMLPGKIGYMKLTQFGRKATIDIEIALKVLEVRKMKGLILDLRGNAGGWLQTAVEIVDKFIDEGKLIVYSKGRHKVKGRLNRYYSTGRFSHPKFPMTILIDGASASASEIVAGSLQYYKRATIIGMRSFGKGSVQEPIALTSRKGARIKLTIAMYYLPNDKCIHNDMDGVGNIIKRNGIIPDIKIEYDKVLPWKNEARAKLEEQGVFKKYIEMYYEKYKATFHKLADNDGLSTKDYPYFDKWASSLKTKASKQDLRYWLRQALRRKVSDFRAKEYACDYLEDIMLQRAIIEVLKKVKLKAQTIKEYKVFAHKFKK